MEDSDALEPYEDCEPDMKAMIKLIGILFWVSAIVLGCLLAYRHTSRPASESVSQPSKFSETNTIEEVDRCFVVLSNTVRYINMNSNDLQIISNEQEPKLITINPEPKLPFEIACERLGLDPNKESTFSLTCKIKGLDPEKYCAKRKKI